MINCRFHLVRKTDGSSSSSPHPEILMWDYFTSGTFYLRKNHHLFSPFKKNNKMEVFLFLFHIIRPLAALLFPFHIFMPLANFWLIRLQGQFLILRAGSCPDLSPLIRSPRRLLTLIRGRILTPGFIRLSPTLAVYDVAQSVALGVGYCLAFTMGWDPNAFLIPSLVLLRE